jgi:hypothetical protein
VDKNLVVKLLRDCAALTADEASEVIKLKAQFPYSQALHILSAKLSKDYNLPEHVQELQRAAVYASDRSVLKDIMSGDISSQDAPSFETGTQNKQSPSSANIDQQKIAEIIDSTDVADTVMNDLHKLSELKHNFEMLFADRSTVSLPVSSVSETSTAETKDSGKSKKERIIELAKSVNTPESDGVQDAIPPVTRRKKRDHAGDELIEEIKTSKEELEPENEKQKEQIELIEHFIKKQPSIPNQRERAQSALPDLNTIKSGEFGDNIVSETLVEILLKQGKKERAIEVLKKLIWKYPQKKAYFASQIEELKK